MKNFLIYGLLALYLVVVLVRCITHPTLAVCGPVALYAFILASQHKWTKG